MHAATPQPFARKNVAVAGLRLGRFDAEGDNVFGVSSGAASETGGAVCFDVEDDVVGCERQHHGLRVAESRDSCRCCDGRARIAPHRFDHHSHLNSDFLGLPASKKMEIRPGDYDRLGEHLILDAQQGVLVRRPVTHQR